MRTVLGLTRRQAAARAEELQRMVEIRDPDHVARRYPHEISGGMAQRVLIVGAMSCDPELLIADEPTTALDVRVQAEILDLLRRLQRERSLGVLLVTHNLGVVADLCDRVAVMSDSTIVETGDTPALLGAPKHPYTRKLLDAVLDDAPGRPAWQPASREEPRPMNTTASLGPRRAAIDDVLLACRGLRVSFPGKGRRAARTKVLNGVDLDIRPAETLGLVGESGSGKTTIGRAVLGLVPLASGTIHLGGQRIDTAGRARRRTLSRDLQVIFQDPYTSLNPAHTIGDTLAEPLTAHGHTSTEARARIRELLGRVHLPENAAHRLPREFSGGQRQRIAIARALALGPRLIVCDEPVSALDLTTQRSIMDLLLEIQDTTVVAYLFISHDLSVVRCMSHRVSVLHHGDIVETGPAEHITRVPQHPYTRELLLAAPVVDVAEQRRRRTRRTTATQDARHARTRK
ncbi:ATP-binding cassette domain-containing protein [Streptomyces sp. SID5910]|nr:ATP-binding cassette domain-containing protein [Streptomyces sp. SID5910]